VEKFSLPIEEKKLLLEFNDERILTPKKIAAESVLVFHPVK
jgi:hypothetical protein